MHLELETLPDAGAAVITIKSSHLDAANVKLFKEAVQPILDKHGAALIDMSALNFVDSSGLGALLSCLRTMNDKGGQLKLFAMDRAVQALFELVRMHRIFSIYNNRKEAVSAL